MSRLNEAFDYVFYRVYWFYRRKGDNTPVVFGSIIVSLMQGLGILDLAFLGQLFFSYEMPSKYIAAFVFMLFMAINWRRYERDFDISKLEEKWDGESNEQKVKGGQTVVLTIIGLMIFPIVIGVLRHNLDLF